MKVRIKKSTNKVERIEFDPALLRDVHRDPAGRLPSRTANEFVPPVPAEVVNLRGVIKPSQRLEYSKAQKPNKTTKLSDIL